MAKKLIGKQKRAAGSGIKSKRKSTSPKVNEVVVMCPECGSDNVTPFVEGSNDFTCNACGEEFSTN